MILFESDSFILIHNQDLEKLNKKNTKGIFVGYDLEELSYRIYILKKRPIEVSYSILFKEEFSMEYKRTEIHSRLQKKNIIEEKQDANSTSKKASFQVDRQEEHYNDSDSVT